jgi:hypothetical protein
MNGSVRKRLDMRSPCAEVTYSRTATVWMSRRPTLERPDEQKIEIAPQGVSISIRLRQGYGGPAEAFAKAGPSP